MFTQLTGCDEVVTVEKHKELVKVDDDVVQGEVFLFYDRPKQDIKCVRTDFFKLSGTNDRILNLEMYRTKGYLG